MCVCADTVWRIRDRYNDANVWPVRHVYCFRSMSFRNMSKRQKRHLTFTPRKLVCAFCQCTHVSMHANLDMQVRHVFSLRANTRVHTVWHTKQGDSVPVHVAGRVSCPLTVHHQHGRRVECAPLVSAGRTRDTILSACMRSECLAHGRSRLYAEPLQSFYRPHRRWNTCSCMVSR